MSVLMEIFILCFLVTVAHAQNVLQVNTTEGVVQGSTAADGNYYAFYDIQYAGDTSGTNRFKAPTPPAAHSGIYIATNKNIICAQPTSRGIIGNEDCLTLSIFTRNVTTPKPVFVWLNAEDYTTTTTAPLSPRSIVEENLVFVTLNFRVSIFGFLCLRVSDAPGNAGLKDIIQGLQWIKANIANFGGNPNNVVLVGHSSGAALVDLLTMSPRTENLIHKAIALSGSALSPWALSYDPIGYAKIFGSRLNITKNDPQNLAKMLQSTDINSIGNALNFPIFGNNTPLFAPCLELHSLNPNETVLLDAPINLLRTGNFSHIPYIAGYTTREGTMRAAEAVNDENWLRRMYTNFTEFLPVDLDFKGNETIGQSIRKFYFDDSVINMATINDYLDYQGDTLILVSVIRTISERALKSNNTVRLIEFAYRGTLDSEWPYPQIPLTGARHGAFINFLFNYNLIRPGDEPVMKSLISRFSSFAYTGEPTPSSTFVTWPPIKSSVINYIYYGGSEYANSTPIYTEEAKVNPHTTRMTFWEDIYSKYYVAPKVPSSANAAVVAFFLLSLSQILHYL